jgi:ABC-2 type transport system permease protein
MNTQSNAVPDSPADSQVIAPAAMAPTRPMYWSVRRELWENRSIYIAPLAVAGLFLLGFLVNIVHLAGRMRAASALDPTKLQKLIEEPYHFSSLLLMGTAFIVSVFYCLDALYGERRDRSVLFWKSLPVSDVTTVLSKATIPLVILPLLTFAITALTQGIMYLISNVVLLGSVAPVATLRSHLPLWQLWLMLLYHLVGIHGLWYAPIYGWLLLVSAWARRAPFLWAALPPFAIGILEKITFNTSHFAALLGYRFMGGPEGAKYVPGSMSMDPLSQLSPGHFLISSGLWFGFVVAAAFLAAAVRLRRYHDPI